MTTSDQTQTADTDDRTVWQIVREDPAIIGYAVCANAGPLLFGYDDLVLGTIIGLPSFALDFAEPFGPTGETLMIPALWQGLWTASNQLSMMLGALANATYFLIMARMNPAQSLKINQIGISLGIPCILISYYTMQKFGRRAIVLASMGMLLLIFLGMGIAGLYATNTVALKFIGVALLLVGFVGELGVMPACQVVASEIPSVRLRTKTLSSGFVMNAFWAWAFAFVVSYMFNADAGNLGGKIEFVFVGLAALGIVLVWIEIPETRDKKYAQLDLLFESKTKTRAFKAAVVEGLLEVELDGKARGVVTVERV
jgi:MFS family permease